MGINLLKGMGRAYKAYKQKKIASGKATRE